MKEKTYNAKKFNEIVKKVVVIPDNMFGYVGGLMSYSRYLCLFAYSGVQHVLCCVLAVSLDCPFLIAPSVFSNVYLQ